MNKDVKIFAKTIEETASEQIEKLMAHPVSEGSKVRIMPDVHAGAGCTIGTTMTIKDRICPNLVGVDIGCGMLAVKLPVRKIDFDELDRVIRWNIPSGFSIRSAPISIFNLDGLKCQGVDKYRASCSIGTLGGGNHYIEVDRQSDGTLWLVIHSGSRHLGLEVAKAYQERAYKSLSSPSSLEIAELIREYKAAGRQEEIAFALSELKKSRITGSGDKDLAYLTGADMADYLNDIDIIQKYADRNRRTIANVICKEMKMIWSESFTTIHNYVDTEQMILRKGAVSAKEGERIIIPMNMRDGALICVGKGNEDWNYSAPHGAGRLMSRNKARESVTLGQYKNAMKGIHTSCVSYETIDESPFAYKDMAEIVECIKPTCTVKEIIKPVYNFKASS